MYTIELNRRYPMSKRRKEFRPYRRRQRHLLKFGGYLDRYSRYSLIRLYQMTIPSLACRS